MKKHIPNFLTTLNLASGLVSITLVMQGNLVWAAIFIFIATVFDYLDGTAARLLKAFSELGKQLDSLADLVSFGVAPGLIIYQLLSDHCINGCNILERWHVIPYFALLIPVCSALRLAKFNIDLRQTENFIGLPTPANAIFFASIPLIIQTQTRLYTFIQLDFLVAFFSIPRVLAVLSVFFSYLLVSEFKLFSLKFKSLEWKGNEHRYIFLILSLALLVVFSVNAIPMTIVAYLLLSLIYQKKI
ncbi:MAG: CDP-diacylglycerol--serine O-phosphatidyltransferase [Bacteroidetes bacterium]|nr:CDP-diacylglycerol--serine O-phosphatidyltransferase [Bacteroidota bacterium]